MAFGPKSKAATEGPVEPGKSVHLGFEGPAMFTVKTVKVVPMKKSPIDEQLEIELECLDKRAKGKVIKWYGRVTGQAPNFNPPRSFESLTLSNLATGGSKSASEVKAAYAKLAAAAKVGEKAVVAAIKALKICALVQDEEVLAGGTDPTGRMRSVIPLRGLVTHDQCDEAAQVESTSEAKVDQAPKKRGRPAKVKEPEPEIEDELDLDSEEDLDLDSDDDDSDPFAEDEE